MKKYELLAESKTNFYGRDLFRIKALVSFTTVSGYKVEAGDIGGWIEKESNLSHEGNAWVYGDAEVRGNAEVCGDAEVFGNARVYGDANVYGNANVCDNARVCGNAWVYGNAVICGDAKVSSNKDYTVFKNFWSSGRYFTYTLSNKMWTAGCFHGTGSELVKKAYEDSEESGKYYEAHVKFVESLEALSQS